MKLWTAPTLRHLPLSFGASPLRFSRSAQARNRWYRWYERFSFQLGQPLCAQDNHVLDGLLVAFVIWPTPEAKTKPAETGRPYRGTYRKELRWLPSIGCNGRWSINSAGADDPYQDCHNQRHDDDERGHEKVAGPDINEDGKQGRADDERYYTIDVRYAVPSRYEGLTRSQNLKLTLDLSYFVRRFLVGHRNITARPSGTLQGMRWRLSDAA